MVAFSKEHVLDTVPKSDTQGTLSALCVMVENDESTRGYVAGEYLIKNGCERCVDEIRDHSFRIRQLQEFNYYEEKLDRGQGVREKAKQLVELRAPAPDSRWEFREGLRLGETVSGFWTL